MNTLFLLFLTEYIEAYLPAHGARMRTNQYRTTEQAIRLIKRLGAVPVVAHPTRSFGIYASLPDFQHMEIYNAYFRYSYVTGDRPQDDNRHFVKIWDALLNFRSTRIWGYAVNDWHGPFNTELRLSHPEIFDSGKLLVMLPEFTLEAYRRSIEEGAFFAVVDLGREKNRYPRIDSIVVSEAAVTVFSRDADEVRWIGNGVEISVGHSLLLRELPGGLRFVRAEVSNANGWIYVQPLTLTPLLAAR